MALIKPMELKGNWVKGFALALYTESSDYLGENEYGHPQFRNEYTPLGELLYRLKYKSDKSVLAEIAATARDFLANDWKITGDLHFLVPIPPSNLDRAFQPVIEIARKVGLELGLPVSLDALVKIRETPTLKDIDDPARRKSILKDVFQIKNSIIKGKNVLLFDDLFRSGVTLTFATEALYNGGVNKVYTLALTKTRTKR